MTVEWGRSDRQFWRMTLAQVDALARGQQRRTARPPAADAPGPGGGNDLAMWERLGVPVERVVSDG